VLQPPRLRPLVTLEHLLKAKASPLSPARDLSQQPSCMQRRNRVANVELQSCAAAGKERALLESTQSQTAVMTEILYSNLARGRSLYRARTGRPTASGQGQRNAAQSTRPSSRTTISARTTGHDVPDASTSIRDELGLSIDWMDRDRESTNRRFDTLATLLCDDIMG
jgi:hypothetical protein